MMKSTRKTIISSLDETKYHDLVNKTVKSDQDSDVDIIDIDEAIFSSNRFDVEEKVQHTSDLELIYKEEGGDENPCGQNDRSNQIVFMDEIVKEEPVFYDANEEQVLSSLDFKKLKNKNSSEERKEMRRSKRIEKKQLPETRNDSSDEEVDEVVSNAHSAVAKKTSHATETKMVTKMFTKILECYICKFRAKTVGSLKTHFLVHSTERSSRSEHHSKNRNYDCTYCSRQFDSFERLESHKRIHTDEKPFECSVCHRMFNNKYSLKIHNRMHTGEKPYRCDQCQMSFRIHQQLITHKKTHGETKPKKEYGQRNQPEFHLIGYRNYECYLCQFRGNLRQVSFHMRKKHTGQKIFRCKICSQHFFREDHISAHMRSSIHSTKREFECEICGRCFALKDGIRQHLKTHIKKHVVKPHECSFCEMSFTRKSYMKRHALTHTGARPFPCSDCKMAFTRNYLLTEHKQKRHGLN